MPSGPSSSKRMNPPLLSRFRRKCRTVPGVGWSCGRGPPGSSKSRPENLSWRSTRLSPGWRSSRVPLTTWRSVRGGEGLTSSRTMSPTVRPVGGSSGLGLGGVDPSASHASAATGGWFTGRSTEMLDRPVSGRVFFEEVIRENLDIGRPDHVGLVFDRRFRTRVLTAGVTPSLHVDYKHSKIKQYHKEGRALRTETTINDSRDFAIGKRLCNLPALGQVVVGTQRASALPFDSARTQALLSA